MRRFLLTVVVVLAGCAAEPQVRYEAPADTNTSIAIRKIELEGYLQKVLAKAKEYAQREKLKLRTEEFPAIRVCQGEDELTAVKAKKNPNSILCGLCDYDAKTLYVLGMDYETLAHEFGHWYFGESEDRADDFAWFFCKHEKVKAIPILNR